MPAPKVFISYSHDSEAHKKWVRDLADMLRKNGINIILDQYEVGPGSNLPKFMETLTDSDRILAICTKKYVEKANKGEGGVGYEKMILTASLMKNSYDDTIIPIIGQTDTTDVPVFLEGKMYINFSDDSNFKSEYDKLLRALHKVPLYIKSDVGPNPFNPDDPNTTANDPDTTDDKKQKKKRRRVYIFSAVIILLLISSILLTNTNKGQISIATSFKNASLENLQDSGWRILSINHMFLDSIKEGLKQNEGLRLYTLPGDYWVLPTARRFIDNAFVLSTRKGDFKAKVTMSYDHFKFRFQQAGMVLLNDTTNLEKNCRFTVVSDSMLLPKSFKEWIPLQFVTSKRGDGKNQWSQFENDSKDLNEQVEIYPSDRELKKLTVVIQMARYRNYIVGFFKPELSRGFEAYFADKISFPTKFIGLVAFQGQIDNNKANNYDTVRVLFSDFQISELTSDDKKMIKEKLPSLLKKWEAKKIENFSHSTEIDVTKN